MSKGASGRFAPQRGKLSLGIQLALLTCCGAASVLPAMAATDPAAATSSQAGQYHQFDVKGGALEDAMLQLARQAGAELYLTGDAFAGLYANPVQGRYSLDGALRQLLSGLPVSFSLSGGAERPVIHLQSAASAGTDDLHPTYVYSQRDGRSRDEKGYSDIYDQDISTVYAGKEQIERYKGAAPADVFKGMLNVYSGDARNSGALDPNVRGIQGPGRVPLTIDGTEQALTVYRGYMGANNRNYIDPNLIGSIKVIKGPNLERNVYSGVGGAVVANTLSVDDILKEGEEFGGEFKIEGSNNSVSPRLPTLLTGQMPSADYQYFPINSYYDPSLYKHPRTSSSNDLLSSDDKAYRLALGTRQEHFDLMGAYAYREKGNHYAGKKKSSYYSSGELVDGKWDYVPNLARIYKPGDEVPNSSSKMESWLAKATWKIDEGQSLEFGYRATDSLYGEILPSRISFFTPGSTYDAANYGVPQWPLSHVDSKAYNVEYKLNPEDNRWVDFYSNLWMTRTLSDTYSAGGVPNETTSQNPEFRNTAVANAKHDRAGLTVSNKLKLLDSLDLTLGGSYQHEKLSSGDSVHDLANGATRLFPRAGRREEQEYNFNFDWQPVSFARFTAGGRYSSYWSYDDFLKGQQRDTGVTTQNVQSGKRVGYTTRKTLSQEEWRAAVDEKIQNMQLFWDIFGATEAERQADIESFERSTPYEMDTEQSQHWAHDGKGKYQRSNNPCIAAAAAGENVVQCFHETYDGSANVVDSEGNLVNQQVDTSVKHRRDQGWVPNLSATFYTSENGRFYLRYSEAIRYPSMFESTVGFSASLTPWDLEPEHAHNYEVAYIHNLSGVLGSEQADVKLTYYHNTTDNVIERSPQLVFSNVEKQTTSGIELQGRYDSGRFFTDVSVAHVLKNKVCDENSAMQLDPSGSTPDCVDDGFLGGYLVGMAMPEWSANLGIGARFLDRRLEVGGRVIYYKGHDSKFHSNYAGNPMVSYYLNTPLSWDDIVTYDAYVNYKLTDDVNVELVGTNLGNLYYLDPLTRSAMPAPGRTLKIGLTANF
ncbi:TonB-dependent receptor domain-containing protein [Pseudomonas sp. NPDC089547]|uniref:TonB-dependent receptor domain-containing protein n=1 Tax=Pseudomonas sp. NPDC089547 TaxID=3390652 RepID=UPI003CFF0589